VVSFPVSSAYEKKILNASHHNCYFARFTARAYTSSHVASEVALPECLAAALAGVVAHACDLMALAYEVVHWA
jgi:hypothetical protein